MHRAHAPEVQRGKEIFEVEVQHHREGVNLHVRETGVHATFEVRGADHAAKVIEAAHAAGYPDLHIAHDL